MAAITETAIIEAIKELGPLTTSALAKHLDEPVSQMLRSKLNRMVNSGHLVVVARMRGGGVVYGSGVDLPAPAPTPEPASGGWEFNLYGWAKNPTRSPESAESNDHKIIQIGTEWGLGIPIYECEEEDEVYLGFFDAHDTFVRPFWIIGLPALMEFVLRYKSFGTFDFEKEVGDAFGRIIDGFPLNEEFGKAIANRLAGLR